MRAAFLVFCKFTSLLGLCLFLLWYIRREAALLSYGRVGGPSFHMPVVAACHVSGVVNSIFSNVHGFGIEYGAILFSRRDKIVDATSLERVVRGGCLEILFNDDDP